jgi:superfamily II DNA or RNA helicase
MDFVEEKLLNYQIPHFYQLHESLIGNKCSLDTSDTGTGKTYTALALCRILGLAPLIVCPKSVIYTWQQVAKFMDTDLFGVSNYESMKRGKYYIGSSRILCPFFDVMYKSSREKRAKKKRMEQIFRWRLPENVIIIFDEAHRCKNYLSDNSWLLCATANIPNKVLLLSATIADKCDYFKSFGYVLGLYENPKHFKRWIKNYLYGGDTEMIALNKILFPKYGSRMKIKELGDMFPNNQVVAQCYHMQDHEKINALYEEINGAMADLKHKEDRAGALARIIRARQRIELLKIPTFLELANDYLENNLSVVIFVNFRETMKFLCDNLHTDCVIHGGQTLIERNKNIISFQSNKSRIIIAIIQAGGVGISLHDLHGNHQRVSIISPTWSAQDLVQALGRIHRAGSQTAALQRIIYCANSIEEKISSNVTKKLGNLSSINDGDVKGMEIPEEAHEGKDYIDERGELHEEKGEDDELLEEKKAHKPGEVLLYAAACEPELSVADPKKKKMFDPDDDWIGKLNISTD